MEAAEGVDVTGAPIRVGLLAYGAIGHEHSQAVQATPGMVLAAVCDTNPARIEAALALAPSAEAFTDGTEMLDSGLIDLVVISTPPDRHFAGARDALSRGIHVVLEKPMALTTVQCDELIACHARPNTRTRAFRATRSTIPSKPSARSARCRKP